MVSRIAALVCCVLVLLVLLIKGGIDAAVGGAILLLIPFLIIWCAEGLSDYLGGAGRGVITSTSPEWLVALFGWGFLIGAVWHLFTGLPH